MYSIQNEETNKFRTLLDSSFSLVVSNKLAVNVLFSSFGVSGWFGFTSTLGLESTGFSVDSPDDGVWLVLC